MHFQIDWGIHALLRLVAEYEFQTVIDVGAGAGEHKRFLEYMGKDVKSVDFDKESDYRGDFMELDIQDKFDVVWCSHTLEHQRNVGAFLEKLIGLLKPDGILVIIVPIHSQNRLIAGHLTAWSIHLLCYNLILAGLDCSKAQILNSYELSLITRVYPIKQNWKHSIIGDDHVNPMKSLESYFPLEAKSGTEVQSKGGINWGNVYPNMQNPVEIECKHFHELVKL